MIEQQDFFLDYDAAYVMGALDPNDRRAFEEHLGTCARCTAAVSELAGMPGLLAQVPAQQVLAPRATPEPVPDTLLPRLAAAIRKQRLRRRVWTGVVAAAAACLVTGIVLVTSPWSAREPQSTAVALPMTALASVPVTATVRLDPADWGTEVRLECTYRDESPEPAGKWDARTYTLVVVPKNGGAAQQVSHWTALPGKTVKLTGSTNLTTAQIKELQLVNSRGVALLRVSPSV